MIDPIAKLHSPDGTLLSVYVNRRAPATRAVLVELLKPLAASGAGRRQEKSIRSDCARIIDMAARIDGEPAPAVAVFASAADGILEFQPLVDPVEEDVAVVGARPYLRPLRAQPRPLRVGVLVADSNRARTFLSTGGRLTEIGDALTVETGKENYGGFAGLEEHHNRARADEISLKLWRQAGRRLLEAHQDQPLELLVVGGHDEHADLVVSALHTYLQSIPRARIQVDPASKSDLAAAVEAAVQERRTRAEDELVARLMSELDAGGGAVAGLAPVLAAANAHAVDHLVVAGPFAKGGVMCDSCGWLGRTETECPVCAGSLVQAPDIVAAAMDSVVEAGGRVTVVSVASRLDAAGVAAFTRFKLG